MNSPTLTLVCAWCRVIVTVGAPGAGTSHGICLRCARQIAEAP